MTASATGVTRPDAMNRGVMIGENAALTAAINGLPERCSARNGLRHRRAATSRARNSRGKMKESLAHPMRHLANRKTARRASRLCAENKEHAACLKCFMRSFLAFNVRF